MKSKICTVPNYAQLIDATFHALKLLDGSGKNSEINEKAIEILKLDDEVLSVPHLGSSSLSEVTYRLAWARTLLKNYGAIENSARSVWSITPQFTDKESVDADYIEKNCRKGLTHSGKTVDDISEKQMEDTGAEVPDEVKPWRKKLYDVLLHMNPYSFERLSQRLLRECGFDDVHVTKKSGDGGIDGTGKLKINGIFSFNIAFQCKRIKDLLAQATFATSEAH